MTNVYVGFHDQRSCNRILKPPGGGTSTIFGGDLIPDVIPLQARREVKHRGTSIQDVLQTESISTSTTSTTSSSTSTVTATEENNSNIKNAITNGDIINKELTEVALESPQDVTSEVTCQVEQLKIEERSSKSEVTETDSDGNTKVVSSEESSDGSMEQSSNFKKGATIGDILVQDGVVEEKKKAKGSPSHRVPPGGYSSGLW